MSEQHEENADLQELRKLGYDGIPDVVKNEFQSWDDLFTRRRSTLAKDYLKGKIRVHLHMAVRIDSLPSPAKHYCIVFQLDFSSSSLKALDRSAKVMETNPSLALFLGLGNVQGEFAMLVDPIQVMELPESVRSEILPSVVRLKPLDDCLGCRMDAINLGVEPIQLVSLNGELLKNRELGLADLTVGHGDGVFFGECHSQVIECGSHVEQAIPDNQTPYFGNVVNALDSESSREVSFGDRFRRHLRVWFVNDDVGFAIDPQSNLLIEAIEVFACPVEFQNEAGN